LLHFPAEAVRCRYALGEFNEPICGFVERFRPPGGRGFAPPQIRWMMDRSVTEC
jgi:hypothetical protein